MGTVLSLVFMIWVADISSCHYRCRLRYEPSNIPEAGQQDGDIDIKDRDLEERCGICIEAHSSS